jgi:type III secretion protein T
MDLLVDLLKPIMLAGLVCMGRLVPIFRMAPFLGPNILTGLMRNSIIIAMVFLIYPAVRSQMPPDLDLGPGLVNIMLKEVIIGILIGYLVSLIFYMAGSVGFIIDNQRGAGMAQDADPLTGEMSSPTGNLLFQCIIIIFFLSGGFLVFLGMVFESYRLWPVFSFYPSLQIEVLVPFFARQLDLFMYGVLVLGAPMLIICFLVDFSMGLMNRFAPQLNVFFLAMPVKSGFTSFLLVLYLAVLFTLFRQNIFKQLRLLEMLGEVLS